MKKQLSFLTLVSTAVLASVGVNAADEDFSRATANWQGIVPGVELPSGNVVITGKDKSADIPVGQLMRTPEGNLFGHVIDLEAWEYQQYIPADGSNPETLAGIGDNQVAVDWSIEAVKFYVSGVEITDIGWEVKDATSLLGTVAADTGVVDSTPLTDLTSIKLNVSSITSDESNVLIDAYAGKEAAISVTVLADNT